MGGNINTGYNMTYLFLLFNKEYKYKAYFNLRDKIISFINATINSFSFFKPVIIFIFNFNSFNCSTI